MHSLFIATPWAGRSAGVAAYEMPPLLLRFFTAAERDGILFHAGAAIPCTAFGNHDGFARILKNVFERKEAKRGDKGKKDKWKRQDQKKRKQTLKQKRKEKKKKNYKI